MFINKAEVILLNIKMNYHVEEYNGRKEYYSRGKTVNAVVRFKEHEIVAEYNVPAGIDNPVEIREYIASIYDRGLDGKPEEKHDSMDIKYDGKDIAKSLCLYVRQNPHLKDKDIHEWFPKKNMDEHEISIPDVVNSSPGHWVTNYLSK